MNHIKIRLLPISSIFWHQRSNYKTPVYLTFVEQRNANYGKLINNAQSFDWFCTQISRNFNTF